MWLVVDNGGGYVKFGLASGNGTGGDGPGAAPETAPNCVAVPRRGKLAARALCGAAAEPELRSMTDDALAAADVAYLSDMSYSRPMERGMPTNADLEEEIWAATVAPLAARTAGGGGGGTAATALEGVLVTMAPFTPRELEGALVAMVQRQVRVPKVVRRTPAQLVAGLARERLGSECCVVVDCGYSFSHVSPAVGGSVLEGEVRRIDVGGKLLTNLLKEMVSYGSINLSDDTFVVEQLKRDVCYVSLDPAADLAALAELKQQGSLPRRRRLSAEARRERERRFTRRYVLPDFGKVKRGYVLGADVEFDEVAHLEKQIIQLQEACFLVPEVLFSPNDLGIQQAGLVEVVQAVVGACPIETQTLMRRNVVVTGGCSLLPGFCERLQKDLGEQFEVKRLEPQHGAFLGGVLDRSSTSS